MAGDDEAAALQRYLDWAELMPVGRIEVEGARVHLLRHGDRTARQSFTLSTAVVSRGASTFNAYGTMLLAQDVGQSLFVSAKIENLGPKAIASGNLRLIARRVVLDKLSPGLQGRGTIDAKFELRDGHVAAGSWQASARELVLASGARFDHLSLSGTLRREFTPGAPGRDADLLVDLTDLQFTRGARLERAPQIAARLALEPRSTRIARTTVTAERIPFMAAEFVAGMLAPELEGTSTLPGGWSPVAGELRSLAFDSGERRVKRDAWVFTAEASGVELARASDRARLSQLAGRIRRDARGVALTFDSASPASLRLDPAFAARPVVLAGSALRRTDESWHFDSFTVHEGAAGVEVRGDWAATGTRAAPLQVSLTRAQRGWLADAWMVYSADAEPPAMFADLAQGEIVSGSLRLVSLRADDGWHVDWLKSSGKLELASLATAAGAGPTRPQLAAGAGSLEFARGVTTLRLTAGTLEDLSLTRARIDWPRTGAPRLTVALEGALDSPWLRETLAAQGLDRLTGRVALDAEARGERALHDPATWRVNARVSNASIDLADALPAVEQLAGSLRFAEGQLRTLELAGSWIGGPVEIAARRATTRGPLTFALEGSADARAVLELLGRNSVATRLEGELKWSGTAQRVAAATDDAWKISLSSDWAGVESRLPEPFGKARSQALPLNVQLRVDARGVREFSVNGRDLELSGAVTNGAVLANFDVQGVTGEVRRVPGADPQIEVNRLDVRQTPALLAAASSLLPADSSISIDIAEVRSADRTFGALRASLDRRADALRFSLESPEVAVHRVSLQGQCAAAEHRCRASFSANSTQLARLLRGTSLPAEWPTAEGYAAGELSWPDGPSEIARTLTGRFDLETQGDDSGHTMTANATLADGQITLANVQGTGPAADQVFRGSGRVGLLARDYDLTVDYEQLSLAATAMPTPARARLARAWNALRGSAARRGWTEAPETRRVQWHGYWE